MTTSRKTVVVGILVVVSVLLLYYVVHPFSRPIHEIILAENASPLSSVTIIAHEKGFFADEGLNVKVSRFTSGKLALDAVLGGGADIATVAETPIMFAGLSAQDFRVFATIFLSPNACKVVARRDHGIHEPIDLKGKKIATFFGTNAEFFASKFLHHYNMSTSDVTLINLSPTDMVVALYHGDIDAYIVWEPFIYNGNALLGDRAVIFETPGIYMTTFNIVAKPGFLKNSSREASAFVKALRRASTFVSSHPSDAIAIVAHYTNIPPTTLEKIWKDYRFEVNTNNNLKAYLDEQAEWAVSKGAARGPIPDYNKYLDSQFTRSTGE